MRKALRENKPFWEKENKNFREKFNQKQKMEKFIRKIGRKGQAEISETLLVLLVVVVLIVAGIFVYYLFFYRSLGGVFGEKIDFENLILLYTFSQMPEVKCENEDCVDVVKLFSFKELIEEKKGYYASRFGKRRIIIENIYPELKEETKKIECDLKKYQQDLFPENCGFMVIFDNLENKEKFSSVSLPVSLYYSGLNEYRIGVLRVQINN